MFKAIGQACNLEGPTRYRFDTVGASRDDLNEI